MKHKVTRSIIVGLIVLLFVALIPATSADVNNYIKFTGITVDCSYELGQAFLDVERSFTSGSQAAYTITGAYPSSGELTYPVSIHDSVTWFLFFALNSSTTITMTLYNPDGSLASVATAYAECPSGTGWFRNNLVALGCNLAVPDTSVGGTLTQTTPAYFAPGELVTPEVILEGGKSALVLGQDASGEYYKIQWACQYLWVPVSSMGSNYDDVWNGTPLPTTVVE